MFVSVSAGENHTCGIKSTGTLACWGDNSHRQSTPPAGTFVSVSARATHTCGAALCWGSDFFGEAEAPTGGFTAIDAGPGFAIGVQPGALTFWGDW